MYTIEINWKLTIRQPLIFFFLTKVPNNLTISIRFVIQLWLTIIIWHAMMVHDNKMNRNGSTTQTTHRHSPSKGGSDLFRRVALVVLSGSVFVTGQSMAWEVTSKAPNVDSIVNTRHNMVMSYLTDLQRLPMDSRRNNYGEVCVYCHTPHAANTGVKAPLWNRINVAVAFNNYTDGLALTSGQIATNPGANSLTCLSCHDGATAIDAIVNMPGPGKYSPNPDDAFLDSWGGGVTNHYTLQNCIGCHSVNSQIVNGWPEFANFNIGNNLSKVGTQTGDLRDDHPVGVQMPDPASFDFKATNATDGALSFYDGNANGRADKSEIRFYDTGDGFEVECASCHDPHGVESAGAGSVFISSFLRVDNIGSAVCLTCHNK